MVVELKATAFKPEHAGQLNEPESEFYEAYWKGYFKTVVTWYEHIGIGVSAGEVVESVEKARDKSVFDFAVNTGHTLHLDEWVNSPFYKGSTIKLYSGMALQMDIIPVSKKEFVCVLFLLVGVFILLRQREVLCFLVISPG